MQILDNLQTKRNITDSSNNLIFNNNYIAICVWKPDGEIININDKLIKLTGYDKNELLHYNITILCHPIDLQKERTIFHEAIKNHINNFEINKKIIKRNGKIIKIKSYTEIFKETDEKIKYLVSYISELQTTKKSIPTQLSRTNTQMTQNINNIIFTFDTTGKILFANNSFNRIFNKTQINPVGKNCSLFFNITNNNTTNRIKNILQNGKNISNIETSINLYNNRKKHYSFSLSPTKNGNKIEEINCIGTDISKYKITENNIDTTHKKLFTIIAHDLKTPFNTLLGFSDLLRENSEDMSITEISNIAGEMYKSAENGYNLIQNMLHWELSHNGTIQSSKTKINLQLLFDEQIAIHQATALLKNLSLSSKLHEELFVFSDENMLSIIIRNLISNAIKYTNNNGSIFLNAYKKNNLINIIVADTGIGLSKAEIKEINNNICTRKIKTNTKIGFGLIICKEFIKKCNGKLLIESTPNIGSKFIVAIPTT